MVDGQGQVVATVFAALTGTSRPGGFALPNTLVRAQLATAKSRLGTVGTGRCAE